MQEANDTSRILWLAIVGLTEHFLLHRCSVKQYLRHIETLRQAAITSNDKTLQFERFEFQFVLHRHWTLYDSMFHSPQVSTRLGIWSEGGRRKLDQLLAKMGFPLDQCRQRYTLMPADIKQALPAKLETYASEYGLQGEGGSTSIVWVRVFVTRNPQILLFLPLSRRWTTSCG